MAVSPEIYLGTGWACDASALCASVGLSIMANPAGSSSPAMSTKAVSSEIHLRTGWACDASALCASGGLTLRIQELQPGCVDSGSLVQDSFESRLGLRCICALRFGWAFRHCESSRELQPGCVDKGSVFGDCYRCSLVCFLLCLRSSQLIT